MRLGGGGFQLPRCPACEGICTSDSLVTSFSYPRHPPLPIMTQRAKGCWVKLGLPGSGLPQHVIMFVRTIPVQSTLQRSQVLGLSGWQTRTPRTFAMVTTLHPSMSQPSGSQKCMFYWLQIMWCAHVWGAPSWYALLLCVAATQATRAAALTCLFNEQPRKTHLHEEEEEEECVYVCVCF